jgi:hypothetical protein
MLKRLLSVRPFSSSDPSRQWISPETRIVHSSSLRLLQHTRPQRPPALSRLENPMFLLRSAAQVPPERQDLARTAAPLEVPVMAGQAKEEEVDSPGQRADLTTVMAVMVGRATEAAPEAAVVVGGINPDPGEPQPLLLTKRVIEFI